LVLRCGVLAQVVEGELVGRRMLNSMWASTSRALVKISSAVAVQMKTDSASGSIRLDEFGE
jgi:hypothetical protein